MAGFGDQQSIFPSLFSHQQSIFPSLMQVTIQSLTIGANVHGLMPPGDTPPGLMFTMILIWETVMG